MKRAQNEKFKALSLFLDRDGVLVEDSGYISNPEELRLVPHITDVLKSFENDFRLIATTNQSGIARGFFSEADLHEIHNRLIAMLDDADSHLDAIFCCPHHPREGDEYYKIDSDCRKPKPGMILSAAKEFDIDISKSFMIGDSERDAQAGKHTGAQTILIDPDLNINENPRRGLSVMFVVGF